jgi:PKD repeat protein
MLLILSPLYVNLIGIGTAQVTHNVAVVEVTPYPTKIGLGLGELVYITVVVENQGTETENFSVTVSYDSTVIETQNVTDLDSGTNMTLNFAWDTFDIAVGTYSINATASIVPDETVTADNTVISKVYVVSPYIAVLPRATVDTTLTPGKNYTISIYTNYNGSDIWGYQLVLNYNPTVLEGIEVVNGDLVTEGDVTFFAGAFNNTEGKLSLTSANSLNKSAPLPYPPLNNTGPGILANITFTIISVGDSPIEFDMWYTELKRSGCSKIIDLFTHLDPDPTKGKLLNGLFQNVEEVVHDIAVTKLDFSPNNVTAGEPVTINVTIKNKGTLTDEVSVTVYWGFALGLPLHPIGYPKIVTIGSGENKTLSFTWDTTEVAVDIHPLTAVVDLLGGVTDINQLNNMLKIDDAVEVKWMHVDPITIVSVYPPISRTPVDETFTINITVSDVSDLCAWEFNVSFNPAVLDCTGVEEGPFLKQAGSTWLLPYIIDNTAGLVFLGDSLFPIPPTGASGNGTLATITFNVTAEGESDLHFFESKILRWDHGEMIPVLIPHTVEDGYFDSRAAVFVYPPICTVLIGETFTVNITVTCVTDLYAWNINLTFNPAVLNVVNVTEGAFLKETNETIFLPVTKNNDAGFLFAGALFMPPFPERGATGSGVLATITFKVAGEGETKLEFERSKLLTVISGSSFQIDHEVVDGTVTILDSIPPVANCGSDQTIDEDTLVVLDGSSSSDNIGIINYAWTFIDVSPQMLMGVKPTYNFTAPGIYTITLNVTDIAGNYDTDTVTITVLDITKPVANAGLDRIVNEDTPITLDGSNSSDNVGITTYTWTFTDVTNKILTRETPSYTFNTPSIYTITLNVTDAAGNWATDTTIITILDIAKPIANTGQNQTVNVGEPVTFNASASTDNVGIISYNWDFGDGTTGTDIIAYHTYTKPGTYIVTLTVRDVADNSDTDTIAVTVKDVVAPFSWWILGAVAGIAVIGIALGTFFLRKRSSIKS